MALVDLLGETLVAKDGTKNVQDLVGANKVVGLYFSAHWCPPCRAFTPKLADWHKKFQNTENADNYSIVFVSSDSDQDSFDDYYKSMPWLALPYAERSLKSALSKKYKVEGIPTLVIIDSETGNVITKNGRSIVGDDPEGKDFPWRQQGVLELLKNEDLLAGEGTKKWEDVNAEAVGLYFSAHWCGPCRGFTPQLVKTYKKINETGKKFEIVFISSDRDEESFKEYYSEMPWLSLPLASGKNKKLNALYEVSGIPTLIIIDKNTGKTINKEGRGAIMGDTDGKEFPWFPKPVNELEGLTCSAINDSAALIWFTDESEEKAEEANKVMKPIAEDYLKSSEDLLFFYTGPKSAEDDLSASLRSFISLDSGPRLVMTNVPKMKSSVYQGESIDEAAIKQMIENFKNGKLEWKQIQVSR